MFTKLLKHEWRATRGVIGLLCIIILISGLAIGGVGNYMVRAEASPEAPVSDLAQIICVVLVMVGVIAVAVCCAASVFFVIWRFYESRFTDQGYLTFTLPVNNHQILLSSILNSVFGVLLVIVAAAAAVGIAFALFLLAFPVNLIWADALVSLENAMGQLWNSFVKNWDVLVSLGLSGVLAGLSQLIMFMLAVTIGSIVSRKHKILTAVGVYYGIEFARSVIGVLATAAFTESMAQVFSIFNVVTLVTIVGGYFLMYYLIDRKLNLA